MDCISIEQYLKDYLAGELSPGLMRKVQLHLEACFACREKVARMRERGDVVIPLYLVALAHGEVDSGEHAAVDTHLAYCPFCKDEADHLRQCSNELVKCLSQYRLPDNFRSRVMLEWRPARVGKRSLKASRGLADLIERAESGNVFSYERIVDRFKDYAYMRAFCVTRDASLALNITHKMFVSGLPIFEGSLSSREFLDWISGRVVELCEGDDEWREDESGEGLSGYAKSRKLRRHRLVLDFGLGLEQHRREVFLLCYLQRMGYVEIGAVLGKSRIEVLHSLAQSTREAMVILQADNRRPCAVV